MMFLTVADVNADVHGGTFKFVRVGRELRFVKLSLMACEGHKQLLSKEEYAGLTGAGEIMVYFGHWRFSGTHSQSLLYEARKDRVPDGGWCCNEDCERQLRSEIDRPLRNRWDE